MSLGPGPGDGRVRTRENKQEAGAPGAIGRAALSLRQLLRLALASTSATGVFILSTDADPA